MEQPEQCEGGGGAVAAPLVRRPQRGVHLGVQRRLGVARRRERLELRRQAARRRARAARRPPPAAARPRRRRAGRGARAARGSTTAAARASRGARAPARPASGAPAYSAPTADGASGSGRGGASSHQPRSRACSAATKAGHRCGAWWQSSCSSAVCSSDRVAPADERHRQPRDAQRRAARRRAAGGALRPQHADEPAHLLAQLCLLVVLATGAQVGDNAVHHAGRRARRRPAAQVAHKLRAPPLDPLALGVQRLVAHVVGVRLVQHAQRAREQLLARVRDQHVRTPRQRAHARRPRAPRRRDVRLREPLQLGAHAREERRQLGHRDGLAAVRRPRRGAEPPSSRRATSESRDIARRRARPRPAGLHPAWNALPGCLVVRGHSAAAVQAGANLSTVIK